MSCRYSLGARLLNRTSRRLSLTETGETLYDRALSILEDVAEAEAVASHGRDPAARTAAGQCAVEFRHSSSRAALAALLRALSGYRAPDISLVDRVVDLVEEGYDLAVRISHGGSPTLVSRKLATTRRMICASPDYVARHGTPASPGPQGARNIRLYLFGFRRRMAVCWTMPARSIPSRCARIMRTNNGDTACAAALAGLGIIRQPTFLIGEDLRREAAGALVDRLPHALKPTCARSIRAAATSVPRFVSW